MFRHRSLSNIYNGASCKSYCWSQNHSDLEIRVKLTKVIKYEDVNVTITSKRVKVEIIDQPVSHGKQVEFSSSCLIDGQFEQSVSAESAYWLLDNEEPSIVIYIDKSESMWWKQLLLDEEATQIGPTNFSIAIDNLDDGSRMVVDKLIVEQKKKVNSNNYEDSLYPA